MKKQVQRRSIRAHSFLLTMAAIIKRYVILAAYILFSTGNAARLVPLPKFPAILIFGDSTVDTGNNNYIETILRSDFHPYGQDYPGHSATGRFSDGKLIPDFLASFLKIKEAVPPFLKPNLSDHEIVTGVSFASAGSGYDTVTNAVFKVVPVPLQIVMFKNYMARLKRIVGEQEGNRIISRALVVVSAGTNDISTARMESNDTGYQNLLLNGVQNFTKELYDLGCRSMVVASLPPIGCLPIQMTHKLQHPDHRKCLDDQNLYAQSYNQKLVNMLPQVEAKLSGSKIVYADIYEPLIDMMINPQKYGFMETKRGCCGTGLWEMGHLCNPTTLICGNASRFLFWDSIHPSQSAYYYLAKNIEEEVLPKLF